MRWGLILGVLLSAYVASSASAQVNRFGYLFRGAIETQSEIDQRVKALENDLPVNLSDLIAENNRVEADLNTTGAALSRLRQQLDSMEKKSSPETVEQGQFRTLVASAKTVNCGDTAAFLKARTAFTELHDEIDADTEAMSPFDVNDSTTCEEFRSSGNVSAGTIDRWLHGERHSVEEVEKTRKLTESYERLVSGLRKRQTAISNSLKDIQQRESLTSAFPYFIILFGILSLGAILIVSKMASVELQMEWVASGQITQFVTVMILMIVITMLGLSKTINGETLGTLLGGVAGYVLAQGVGRAAARDASRGLVSPGQTTLISPAQTQATT